MAGKVDETKGSNGHGGARAGAGRPTKLTPEIREKLVTAVRAGAPWGVAAVFSGVGRSSFFEWLARGRREPGTVYAELVDAIEEAEATAKVRAIRSVLAAAPKAWQAAAWWLERTYPDEYARREPRGQRRPRDDGSDSADAPTSRIDTRRLTTDELRDLHKLLAKATPPEPKAGDVEPPEPSDEDDA